MSRGQIVDELDKKLLLLKQQIKEDQDNEDEEDLECSFNEKYLSKLKNIEDEIQLTPKQIDMFRNPFICKFNTGLDINLDSTNQRSSLIQFILSSYKTDYPQLIKNFTFKIKFYKEEEREALCSYIFKILSIEQDVEIVQNCLNTLKYQENWMPHSQDILLVFTNWGIDLTSTLEENISLPSSTVNENNIFETIRYLSHVFKNNKKSISIDFNLIKVIQIILFSTLDKRFINSPNKYIFEDCLQNIIESSFNNNNQKQICEIFMDKSLDLCQRWYFFTHLLNNIPNCIRLAQLISFNTQIEFLSHDSAFHQDIKINLLKYENFNNLSNQNIYFILNFLTFLLFTYTIKRNEKVAVKRIFQILNDFCNKSTRFNLQLINIRELILKIFTLDKNNIFIL